MTIKRLSGDLQCNGILWLSCLLMIVYLDEMSMTIKILRRQTLSDTKTVVQKKFKYSHNITNWDGQ